MRFLVVICLSIILISVAVFPSPAHAQASCSPTTPAVTNTIPPPTSSGSILINEIMAKPNSGTSLDCTTQTISRWLELFNPQNQAYDLGSAHAALDNGAGTISYYLATNTTIAAHGYLVIFSPHILFSGTMRLLFEGILIDQVTVPDLDTGLSYARIPDGGTNWQITTTPTIGSSNNPIASSATATSAPTHTTHKTPTHAKTDHQQKSQHTTGRVSQAIQPTGTSTQIAIEQQPAWSALHLPQVEPGSPPSPTNKAPPVASSLISDSTETLPFLPFLLGGLVLIGLIGTFLVWYRKKGKAT